MTPDFVSIPRPSVSRRLAARGEQCERPIVAALRAHAAVKLRHGFGVVIEHIGLRVEHGVERGFIALKVRDQNLDAARRVERAHGANRRREVMRAAVRHFIPIDGGDDRVLKIELLDGFSDVSWLGRIERLRFAFAHGRKIRSGACRTSPAIIKVAVRFDQHS